MPEIVFIEVVHNVMIPSGYAIHWPGKLWDSSKSSGGVKGTFAVMQQSMAASISHYLIRFCLKTLPGTTYSATKQKPSSGPASSCKATAYYMYNRFLWSWSR